MNGLTASGHSEAELLSLQHAVLHLMEERRICVAVASCALLGALRICIKVAEERTKSSWN